MQEDLIARLATALGSGVKVTWGWRVQGAPLPAVTLNLAAPGRDYGFEGPQALARTLVQVDVWGRDIRDVMPVYAALLAELEQPATEGATRFEMAFLRNERDAPVTDVGGGATAARKSADFLVCWQPA